MAKKYTTGSLFSVEELTRAMGGFDFKEDEPITCLGMEFENDDARRAYFREELRKKLPELKKIEGFPIGEDEDIIQLSDPPYYTACPNPWLNDFIAEWDKEKEQLEREGKRKATFDVKEPYASDVSEGKNNPIYNAHSYHTKVPHPAIMRYILHYTQPGDIVFDGFAGTGMTGVAAHLCGDINEVTSLNIQNAKIGERHSICSDISVIASFISSNFSNNDLGIVFVERAKKILNKVYAECSWMYKTKHINGDFGEIEYVAWSDMFICPNCTKVFEFYSAAYNNTAQKVEDEFHCPHCMSILRKKGLQRQYLTFYDNITNSYETIADVKPFLIKYKYKGKFYTKKVDQYDLDLINKIESMDIPNWYPTDILSDGLKTREPKRTHGFKRVHQFYTKRCLYILSSLYNEFKDSKSLKFLFTTQLINISKQNRYRPGVSFPYNPLNGTIYVSSLVNESNVFVAYSNKIEKIGNALSKIGCSLNVSHVGTATNLSLKSDSIDYIFVDPPFGANIMYSELNEIWENWLKVKTNNKKEAIINDVQNKSLFEYQSLMIDSFREFYRVLKPNKWITIEFSNTKASVWNSIQHSLQSVGFIVANVASIDKQQGSYNAVTSTTAVKQDLVITCYKPSSEIVDKITSQFEKVDNIWDFINNHLEHLAVHIVKNSKTTTVIERSPKILYDRLISYYVQHGLSVPLDAQEFQHGLRERFIERDGMFFTASQVVEYEEKRKHTEGVAPMGIIVSDEANGIEWLKNLLRNNPKTYQEIQPEWMQAINGLRKGDVLPELRDILEENFIQESDGKWRIADPEKQADLDKLYMKNLLKEFNIYVEAANKLKAKPIKQVRIEAVRAGFRDCYKKKDFATIIKVGDKIPQNLLQEDEQLLRYYDVATRHM